jgi:hypothetical protein
MNVATNASELMEYYNIDASVFEFFKKQKDLLLDMQE